MENIEHSVEDFIDLIIKIELVNSVQNLLVVLLVAAPLFGQSQILTPTVINSGGGTASLQETQIVYSIGEVIAVTDNAQQSWKAGFIPSLISIIPVVSGIDSYKNNGEETFHFYPNPVESVLYSTREDTDSFLVYDMQGRLVAKSVHQNFISLSNLKSGAYLVQSRDALGNVIASQIVIKI